MYSTLNGVHIDLRLDFIFFKPGREASDYKCVKIKHEPK